VNAANNLYNLPAANDGTVIDGEAGNSRAVPLSKTIDCNRIKSRIGSGGMDTVV
tara:strand:- start:211 stop:372 length:162 start_codon:yes stop_codon:yes gene_type:complete